MTKVFSAELVGDTAHRWSKLPFSKRKALLSLPFVQDVFRTKIWFIPNSDKDDIERELERKIKSLAGRCSLKYHFEPMSVTERVMVFLSDAGKFSELELGSDVAEHDEHLLEYFISTDAFKKVKDQRKSIVIGPKGSGKSAILRAIRHASNSEYIISLTPEVFAKSLLAQFSGDDMELAYEKEEITVTWMFSILIEVFKEICENPRGVSNAKQLRPIRDYLQQNSSFVQMDMFSRFIGYLRRIEKVKVGSNEVAVKTNELQSLYALEQLYELVPLLRRVLKEDVVILIDELDQGWDNSEDSNKFLAALLQAAIRIRSLDCKIHAVSFVRTEIFDIVKQELEHLDKLRSEIINLRWYFRELAGLLSRRIAYSLKIPNVEMDKVDITVVDGLFAGNVSDWTPLQYAVSRTTMRPREVLQFVKLAHEAAVDGSKGIIGAEEIFEAEKTFSEWKAEHLASEYLHVYPRLGHLLEYFHGFGPVLSRQDVASLIGEFSSDNGDDEQVAWAKMSENDAVRFVYDIEFMGIEKTTSRGLSRSIIDSYGFASERKSIGLHRAKSLLIHPAFWSYLELGEG